MFSIGYVVSWTLLLTTLSVSPVSLQSCQMDTETQESDAEKSEKGHIETLTTDTFFDFTASHTFLLMEFSKPDCDDCKAVEAEFIKAVDILKDVEGVGFGRVDADTEKMLKDEFNVVKVPTLILMKDLKNLAYKGKPNAEEIAAWVKRVVVDKNIVSLESKEDLEAFIKSNDIVVVGFFKDPDSVKVFDYRETAQISEEQPFVLMFSQDVAKQYDVDIDSVILFKEFGSERQVMKEKLDYQSLQHFVVRYSLPLVVEFSVSGSRRLFQGDFKRFAFLFASSKWEEFASVSEQYKRAAEGFAADVIFMFVDTSRYQAPIKEFFNVKGDERGLFYVHMSGMDVRKYKQETFSWKQADIAKFVDEARNMKIKPFRRSEPLPDDWDSKPVKVLVGSNFDDVVLDKNKDVFVLSYAPDCPKCDALLPTWEKLAEDYQGDDSVLITKINGIDNEVIHRNHGFPFLVFVPKEQTEMIEYDGEHTVDAFKLFIKAGGAPAAAAEGNAEEKAEPKTEL